ncbi:MAG: hypothetical protein QM811_00770 [Pirellulales bacterium]
MTTRAAIMLFLCAVAAARSAEPAQPAADAAARYTVGPVPERVRERLKLAPFYTQYCNARGVAIVASSKVDPHALLEAAYLMENMLGDRDDIRRALDERKVRFGVMAYDEMTTDLPEHADLTPKAHWDRRARGLGATTARPAVSCGEENLLGYRGDPYATENILIHEFSHAVHEMALRRVDPTFDRRLRDVFEAAKKDDLWTKTYAMTNHREYWAEGTQSWFDTNRKNDGQHNDIDTREKLKRYDPRLAALLEEIYGDRPWRYVHPRNRKDPAHLADYRADKAPRFVWPKAKEETPKTSPNGDPKSP